jgi:hypothetical protein
MNYCTKILDPKPNSEPDTILFSDPELTQLQLKEIVQRKLTGVETRLK